MVEESEDQGLEEMMISSLTLLTKTSLSKKKKKTVDIRSLDEKIQLPQADSIPKNIKKIQKLLHTVCERIGKGKRISSNQENENKSLEKK